MGQMSRAADGADVLVEKLVIRAINSAADKKEQYVDDDCQKQWANLGVQSYNPDNYSRMTVETSADLDKKVEMLYAAGIPFVQSFIEGKYVIEIPNQIDQSKTTAFYRDVMLGADIQAELNASAQQKEREMQAQAERDERKNNDNNSYNPSNQSWADQQYQQEQQQKETRQEQQLTGAITSSLLDKLDGTDDTSSGGNWSNTFNLNEDKSSTGGYTNPNNQTADGQPNQGISTNLEGSNESSGLSGTMSAANVFAMLDEATGTQSQAYQGASTFKEPEQDPYHQFRPQQSILSQMDLFGRAVSTAEHLVNLANSYGLSDNDVFKNGSHNSRQSKEARVLDGNVIVDGKIIGTMGAGGVTATNAENLERVQDLQSQASSRLAEANRLSKSSDATISANAQMVKANLYGNVTETSYTLKGADSIKSHNRLVNLEMNINSELSTYMVKTGVIVGLTNDNLDFLNKLTSKAGVEVSAELKRSLSLASANGADSATFNLMERRQIAAVTQQYAGALEKDIAKLEAKLNFMDKNSAEYKKLSDQIKSLKSEKFEYMEISKKFRLADEEKKLLTSASETIENLNKDLGAFGISISASKYISRADLLKVNEAFIKKAASLNINVLKSNGMVDVGMLKKLTPEDLKRLGISESTRKLLIDMNSSGAVFGGNTSGLGNLLLSGFFKIEDSEDWASFQHDMNIAKNIGKHSKKAVTHVQRYRMYAHEQRLVRKKAKGDDKWKKAGRDAHKKTAEKAGKSALKEGAPSSKLLEKNSKLMSRKLALQQKWEHSIFGRLNNKYKNLKKAGLEKFKNSKLGELLRRLFQRVIGFLKPVLGGVALTLVSMMGTLCAFLTVLIVITSFLQGAYKIIDKVFAPADYTETTAFALYAYMDGMEGQWLDDVLSQEKVVDYFENKKDMYYGIDYLTLNEYCKSMADDNVLGLGGEYGKLCYDAATDTLYINPFYLGNVANQNADGFTNKSAMTEVTEYDGSYTGTLTTNASAYSKLNIEGMETVTNLAAENGHTKNAKDILCMVDVMYQFQMNDMFNDKGGELYGILGKSPAGIEWTHRFDEILGTAKWLWDAAKTGVHNIFSWFTGSGTDKIPDRTIYINNSVGFEAIQNYVSYLWSASHQQAVALEVQFHEGEQVTIRSTEGGTPHLLDVTDNLEQYQASEFGVCKTPITNTYKLMMTDEDDELGKRITPYLGAHDTRYALDTGEFEVTLNMDKCAEEEEEWCITEEFTNDEESYNRVKDNECWELIVDKEFQDPPIEKTATSGWYVDDEAAARRDAENQATTIYNDHVLADTAYFITERETTNAGNVISDDPLNFKRYYSEKPSKRLETDVEEQDNGWRYESKLGNDSHWRRDGYQSRDGRPDAVDQSGYNWCHDRPSDHRYAWSGYYGDLGNYVEDRSTKRRVFYHKNQVMTDTCEDIINSRRGFGAIIENRYGRKIKFDAATWNADHTVGFFEWWYVDDDGNHTGDWWKTREYWYVVEKSTKYQATTKVDVEERYMDEYRRECKEHDFEYCGGHIGFYSQGIVYSMTNEQLYLSGVYAEDDIKPIADSFDFEANGYDIMKGKHIKKNINYNTALSASTTGMVASPLRDPQGSYIGSKKGLELWVNGGWYEGDSDKYINVSTMFSAASNLTKDIFDVDTGLLKSATVFPVKDCDQHNFEGWTDTNITIAAIKMAQDWYDLYEFDIPLEISSKENYLDYYGMVSESAARGDFGRHPHAKGTNKVHFEGYSKNRQPISGYTLSADDINNIIDALKETYGTRLTAERETAVRSVLGWVGRGHYNPYHEHDFLIDPCGGDLDIRIRYRAGSGGSGTHIESLKRWYNCTGGDSFGFAKFVQSRIGGDYSGGWTEPVYGGSGGAYSSVYQNRLTSSYTNVNPADVIQHFGMYDDEHNPMLEYVDIEGADVARMIDNDQVIEICKQDVTDQAVVYVGVLGHDVELSSGQTISGRVTVELNVKNGVGNIWLNYTNPSDFFSRDYSDNPWYVTHPDERTYVRRLF